ncbi:MAG: glycosyltransferase 87 family protein [Actinomycetota bacterium]
MKDRGLAMILIATLVTLTLGWLLKAPCLGSWADGRQYNRLCYSDVAALYASGDRDRGLDEDRFPYLDGENEYPVLTGLSMWVTALPADGYPTFFTWTALLLTGAALATSALLYRVAGQRAFLFALAPTLAIYGLMNWDLLAVALAAGGTVAYLRKRDTAAGVLLGLGAAAKLYPALLVVPFALGRLRARERSGAARLAGWAAGAWVAVNLPFAIVSFDRWSEFFRFNAIRPDDWDSLYRISARYLGFTWDPAIVNGLALLLFLALGAALWISVGRHMPASETWKLAFPLLILFLLTSKVYSPQYGLWLLPWFALAFPDIRLFAAFQLADIAVFVTRFEFFAQLQGVGDGLPRWSFELAVLVRAAILVLCVIVWARRAKRQPEAETVHALAGAA